MGEKYNLIKDSNVQRKYSKSKSFFKLLLFGFFVLFLASVISNPAQAATIRGTAYDPDIRPMKDVLIEINTTPIQRFLAKDGTYLFSLPIGNYNITAFYIEQNQVFYAEEIIMVNDNGRYLRDLFLKALPGGNLTEKNPSDTAGNAQNRLYWIYGFGTILGLALIGIAYLLIKKTMLSEKSNPGKHSADSSASNSTSEDTEFIIKLMKKNGGRITQKDLRKEISFSEGKVSLMISELEEKGKIKKIKKGRGNILILNK